MKVGIVGLGLIGGSLARDLAALGHSVIAYDRSAATLRAARRARVIAGSVGRAMRELETCEVCILAVPVTDAPEVLARAAPYLGSATLITDVGSTKRSIVQAAAGLGLAARFVGSHPMAGDHRSGWAAARRGLFDGARVCLTPTHRSAPAAVRRVRALWKSLGARPESISAAAHDRLVAAASHLPQLVSSSLAAELGRAGVGRSLLGPGGRDVTRLAGADSRMWLAIATDNADLIAPLVRSQGRVLTRLAAALDRGDRAAVASLFATARAWSDEG